MVQWLRLHTSIAWGTGSILDWGTKIPHAAQHSLKNENQRCLPHRWHPLELAGCQRRLCYREVYGWCRMSKGLALSSREGSMKVCKCVSCTDYQNGKWVSGKGVLGKKK